MADRKRRKLTPMSGELRVEADWAPTEPPAGRPSRPEKTAPVTRREVLVAGLVRIAGILVTLVALVSAVAFLFMWLGDMNASRAFTLAFLVGGAFIAVAGFLMGTTGPAWDVMPDHGYGYERREVGINRSFVYGSFGVVLVLIGIALDALL